MLILFFFSCASLLVAKALGPLTPGLQWMLALLCIAAGTIRSRPRLTPRLCIGLVVLAGGFLWAARSANSGITLGLALIPAWTWLVARQKIEDADESPDLEIAHRVTLVVLFINVLMTAVPWFWHGFQQVGAGISAGAAVLAGQFRSFGATSAGAWVLAVPIGFLLSARLGHLWTLLLGILSVLIVAFGLMIWLAIWPSVDHWGMALLNGLRFVPTTHLDWAAKPSVVASGLAFIPLVFACLIVAAATRMGSQLRRDRFTLPGNAMAIAMIILVALGLWSTRPQPQGKIGGEVVLFSTKTDVDFSRGFDGRHGLLSLGMYGMWERSLEDLGFVVKQSPEPIDAELLEGVNILILVMQSESFEDFERDAIWDFVQAGGGLMVLGDHTDLLGFEEPNNELLEPVGIRFVYDSAYPMRPWWRHSQSSNWHPIAAGIDLWNTSIGTGASLEISDWRVSPVIVGRYGISDYGNRANAGQGGLLGDYRHQVAGEKLGDLPLVAAVSYGQGRVVVFGDTSTFQPIGLLDSRVFRDRVFDFLVNGGHEPPITRLGLLALGLLCGAISIRHNGPRFVFVWGVTLGFGFGTALGSHASVDREISRPIALVDSSLVPSVPSESFGDGASGGIGISLMRLGYQARFFEQASPDEFDDASLLFVIAPNRIPSPEYVNSARALMEKGGTLFLATSKYSAQAVEPLLALCGVAVNETPMGNAVLESNGIKLEFVEAWPLQARPETEGHPPRIVASIGNEAIVMEKKVGKGRCVVFADERFFENENFEDEYTAKDMNVIFVSGLLRQLEDPEQ